MQPMSIQDVIEAVGGELLSGRADVPITGVSTDTRTLKEGDLFFALTGADSDGHKFLTNALSKGAAGLVVSRKVEARATVIRVGDTLRALGDLAAYYRNLFSPVVVGITGSVGKTTTKEMTACMLAAIGGVLKNEGNFNNEIGLPLTLFNLADSHKVAVTEMAMRGSGQISYLANIAKPSIGVITNIHSSHIELLGSLDAIAQAKGELLDFIPEDGYAVLNADGDYYSVLRSRCKCNVFTFGEQDTADIKASSVKIDSSARSHFKATTPSGSFELSIPAPGEHIVKDALAAIAVGEILGVSHDFIRSSLANYTPADKRSNIIKSEREFTVVDDTYNASPASVLSALKTLKMLQGAAKIAVLGDMLELGETAKSSHIQIGGVVAQLGIDMLFTYGRLGKLIAKGALDAGMPQQNVHAFDDAAEMTEEILKSAHEGDVILVKGSRGMKMEAVVDGLV